MEQDVDTNLKYLNVKGVTSIDKVIEPQTYFLMAHNFFFSTQNLKTKYFKINRKKCLYAKTN